jgi:chaperonin GroEL (HSP60 family)
MINDNILDGTINIVSKDTTRKIIYEVLKDIRSAVEHTLGPAGRTTLLHDPSGIASLYPSKDGFRLMMHLSYDNYFYDAVYKILRDVSMHNNITVGDGTTSCVVIIDEFYKTLDKLTSDKTGPFKYISSTGITNILDAIKDILISELYNKGYIKRLQDLSIEEKKTIITKVGSIAANNDHSVGQFVADLFDPVLEKLEELFVDIAPNETEETTKLSEIGFEMPCGHINRVYSTERDGKTAIYHDPRFLLVEGPLLDDDIKTITPIINFICLENDLPLIIIADDYSNKMAQYLYNIRLGFSTMDENTGKPITIPPMKVCPIMHSSSHDLGHERMIDLETSLGGHVIVCQSSRIASLPSTPEEIVKLLGKAKKIVSISHTCRIFGGFGDDNKINARIEELEKFANEMVMNDSVNAQGEILNYKERVGMLRSNMVAIKVGGLTYKERQYKVMIYEDAVYAIKSTIKNGFTLAGQVSIYSLINSSSSYLIDKIIKKLETERKNVIFGTKRNDELYEAVKLLLLIVRDTFQIAYKCALKNAILDDEEYQNILSEVYNSSIYDNNIRVYNLMNDTYEALHSNNELLVAGNTDIEILSGVIGVTNLFINADTLQTLYIPKRVKENDR